MFLYHYCSYCDLFYLYYVFFQKFGDLLLIQLISIRAKVPLLKANSLSSFDNFSFLLLVLSRSKRAICIVFLPLVLFYSLNSILTFLLLVIFKIYDVLIFLTFLPDFNIIRMVLVSFQILQS